MRRDMEITKKQALEILSIAPNIYMCEHLKPVDIFEGNIFLFEDEESPMGTEHVLFCGDCFGNLRNLARENLRTGHLPVLANLL